MLSILQTLLLLGPDHSDIWQALESITNRAILLAQDSHMEPSEKIMQRLLFSKGKSCRGQHELDGRLGRADKGVQTDADICSNLLTSAHLLLLHHYLGVWWTPTTSAFAWNSTATAWWSGYASSATSLTWHGWRPTTTTSITWYGWRPTTSITWYGWRPTTTTTWYGWRPTTTSITWYGWRPTTSITWHASSSASPGMIVAQGSQSAAPTKAHRCPTLRMKKLNWQKLRAVTDGHSMWATVQSEPSSREPDYSSIEQLFSFPVTENKDKGAAAPVKKEPKEITFIDPNKTLNLNIFLKQFKCHDSEWDRTKFDVEVLKQLVKLLPERHEIEHLKSFQGDKCRPVLHLPSHCFLVIICHAGSDFTVDKLRIECMLLCEETSSVLDMLKPRAQLVAEACQCKTSTLMPSFCKLILDVGSFLNYGSHTGNAAGFKISSLLKLTETKANKSRITLLHYILEEAEVNHPELLALPDDIEICENAAGISLESVRSEASALLKRLNETAKKVSTSDEEVKEQYGNILQESLEACQDLTETLMGTEKTKSELAVYLCEDVNQLSLEELFGTIKTFRGLFLKALK
ncbi:hypothetical protein F7725_001377, partial [Dissostichus mawsoni]